MGSCTGPTGIRVAIKPALEAFDGTGKPLAGLDYEL